ncbi:hypothetical protein F4810DRAFT_713301 [Camillea tinctor]|nr:hypothetical protein F4810DRAFT_713301 [Camillea tinctor]
MSQYGDEPEVPFPDQREVLRRKCYINIVKNMALEAPAMTGKEINQRITGLQRRRYWDYDSQHSVSPAASASATSSSTSTSTSSTFTVLTDVMLPLGCPDVDKANMTLGLNMRHGPTPGNPWISALTCAEDQPGGDLFSIVSYSPRDCLMASTVYNNSLRDARGVHRRRVLLEPDAVRALVPGELLLEERDEGVGVQFGWGIWHFDDIEVFM